MQTIVQGTFEELPQLFLRFLFSALLGKPLFHILNSLRQEAVIAQPDELCELSAVKVFRIPRSGLASVEAVLVGREQLFNLFAGAVCFQSFKGIANFVAHEDKVPPVSLGEVLQKPLFPSRIEQNCSVRFFFATSKNGVFLPSK